MPVNLTNQFSYYQQHHSNNADQAESSSLATQLNTTPSNNTWLKNYISTTNVALKEVKKTVNDLALSHNMPFNQGVFEDTLALINPSVQKLIPKALRGTGICLGLSTAWLNAKFSGKNESQFHNELLQNSNGILNKVIKTQYQDQISSQEGYTKAIPPSAIAEYAAMASGMKLVSISQREVSKSIAVEPLANGIAELDRLFKNNVPTQGHLLLSDKHACAMFRDQHDNVNFFDPNQGVIISTPANRANLFGYILLSMNEVSSDQAHTVSVTEVQPNTLQAKEVRSLNPFLS